MIRRKNDHNRIIESLSYYIQCKGYTGCCIPSHRLTYDIIAADTRKLAFDHFPVACICHNINILFRYYSVKTFHRILKHRPVITRNAKKLFWLIFTAYRPEPSALSACHYHCDFLHTLSPLCIIFEQRNPVVSLLLSSLFC